MQTGNIGISLSWLGPLQLVGQTPASLQLYNNATGEIIEGNPPTFVLHGGRKETLDQAFSWINMFFDELEKEAEPVKEMVDAQ